MGIGVSDLDILIRLQEGKFLPPKPWVVEIGAQQISNNILSAEAQLARLAELFRAEGSPPLFTPRPTTIVHGAMEHLQESAPLARHFWKWLGFQYSSIDIDESPESIPLDLNVDSVPPEHHGRYDLVTNLGTTEHVANQSNAFKIIHELTALGGVMFHNLPAQGMLTHGIVNYNPKFFWMLSRSNGYRWIYADYRSDAHYYELPQSVVDEFARLEPSIVERRHYYKVADSGLLIVLQKVFDSPYVPPLDVPSGAAIQNEILRKRYWSVFEPRPFDDQIWKRQAPEAAPSAEAPSTATNARNPQVAKVRIAGSGEIASPWDRGDTWAVAGAAFLAFALRILMAALSPVVGADAYAFLLFASELRRGFWQQGLSDGIHPAYPLAIAGLEPLLGGEASGYALSILFSSLSLLPFYALVRDVAGRRVALPSALFFACLPFHILVQADIMSEGMFHFFFISSAAFSWLGASRSSWRDYALAGLTGGMAYLTRPEGIYTPLATLGVTALVMFAALRRKRPLELRNIAFAAGSLMIFLCLAFPLLLQFKAMTGRWVPSKRGSVESALRAFGIGDGRSRNWPGALRKSALIALGVGLVVLPAAALGVSAARRRMKWVGAAYFICLSIGYALPAAAASAGGYAFTRRYLLIPILFLLPFAPVAWIALADRFAWRCSPRARAWATWVVLTLALAAGALRAVHPRRNDQLPIKEAAIWLHERAVPGTSVHANTSKAMCYLGSRTRELPVASTALEALHLPEGEYALVVEPKLTLLNPEGMNILSKRFARIARFPSQGGSRIDVVSIFAAPPPR